MSTILILVGQRHATFGFHAQRAVSALKTYYITIFLAICSSIFIAYLFICTFASDSKFFYRKGCFRVDIIFSFIFFIHYIPMFTCIIDLLPTPCPQTKPIIGTQSNCIFICTQYSQRNKPQLHRCARRNTLPALCI